MTGYIYFRLQKLFNMGCKIDIFFGISRTILKKTINLIKYHTPYTLFRENGLGGRRDYTIKIKIIITT